MAPDFQDEALGRDSLFKQKLHKLRSDWSSTQGRASHAKATGELQSLQYLAEAKESLQSKDGDELTRLALLDSLTGLYNQKTITRLLADEVKRARRYKRPVAIVIARVQNLDDIIAAGGQLVADTLLRAFAELLLETVRDVDAPARITADAFIVMCPETNRGGAEIIMNRMNERIAGGFQVDIDRRWDLTIGLGIASFPRDGNDPEQLIKAAMTSILPGSNSY